MTRRSPQLLLLDVEARVCSLCGAPLCRPNPACARCDLRRHPLPPAPPDPEADRVAELEAAQAQARLASLAALHRPVRVGLVGCSARKRPGIHPARELYLGSFFIRALPFAEATCDEVWILSALHGLLALTRPVENYDASLPTRHKDRGYWGLRVVNALCAAYRKLPLHLVFLCGAPYVEGVTGCDARTGRARSFTAGAFARTGWSYETPLAGLARAPRFRWFAAHTPHQAPTEAP